MLFRKSSNIENRITIKDLNAALQVKNYRFKFQLNSSKSFKELSIKISQKDASDLAEQYTDQYGIDFEKLHKYFLKIQSNSNSDSSRVKRLEIQTTKEPHSNLLQRIANEYQTQEDFQKNFIEFKTKLNERCIKHHSTKLSTKEVTKLIENNNIPLVRIIR